MVRNRSWVALAALAIIIGVVPSASAADDDHQLVESYVPTHLFDCQDFSGSFHGQCAGFGGAAATDGTLTVIGADRQYAPDGNVYHLRAGAVYVSNGQAAPWPFDEIHNSDAESGDHFGASVAVAGGRFVVGAWGAGADGQVYVYEPAGSGWDETILDPQDTGYVRLGESVAIDGTRIVAGGTGYADADPFTLIGDVYVFDKTPSGWVRTAALTMADDFGHAVDVDGDRIVVGAPHSATGAENSGTVYVLTKNGAAWDHVALSPPSAEEWQLFGWDVAIDGDTVFVSARNRDQSGVSDGGAVFMYDWNGAGWSRSEVVPPGGYDVNGAFGTSIDANDGQLAVGAVGFGSNGAAYVFERSGGWTGHQLPESPLLDDDYCDYFGLAVAAGGGDVIVGSPEACANGLLWDHGTAYLYREYREPPPLCDGVEATLWGDEFDNVLVGTAGGDVIVGGAGNDEIRGLDGDDLVCGGPGDDTLIGGGGLDTLFGDAGNDLIKGLRGDDTASGGDGADRIQGNAGNDTLSGDAGKDKLWGGIGVDAISGGAGNDQVHGGRDDDTLTGGDGTDRMWGDAGADTLLGDGNSDFLYGGIGVDILWGGAGNDRLFGWHDDDALHGESGRDQLRGQDGDDMVDGGPHHDWCSVETVWLNCEAPL